MNNVGLRIKKLREGKGITQEAMAHALGVTQSNYGRLEKDDKRLNVPKIQKIAEILEISVAQIFNESSSKVINQMNNDSPSAYNVENLYQDNKQVYEQLNSALKEHINHLENEVEFLRNCIKK